MPSEPKGYILRIGPSKRRRGAFTWTAIVAAWMLLTLSGVIALARYSAQPGAGASAPGLWPSASHLDRAPDRPSLVMIAHPHCPCTRASLSELARLLARVTPQPAVFILFVRPDGVEPSWHETDLWRQAGEIPGAVLQVDDGGRRASSFGAHTSGETLLYDGQGQLSFHGGITPARGHEGDNAGAERIVALLMGGSSELRAGAVFGCALLDTASALER